MHKIFIEAHILEIGWLKHLCKAKDSALAIGNLNVKSSQIKPFKFEQWLISIVCLFKTLIIITNTMLCTWLLLISSWLYLTACMFFWEIAICSWLISYLTFSDQSVLLSWQIALISSIRGRCRYTLKSWSSEGLSLKRSVEQPFQLHFEISLILLYYSGLCLDFMSLYLDSCLAV